MEHKEIKKNLDSKLQTVCIGFITILNILEVITKMRFLKNHKLRNPYFIAYLNEENIRLGMTLHQKIARPSKYI